ncbi:[acyl-carrier-protein] S-malonyltransferase [Chromatiales bacterium (ex Bugula neritina AB1)]|nr:[acyl-carrier-protein] S-malonyltransferase [Chromatiales bacterium (ex Bugula neritina AB1)]
MTLAAVFPGQGSQTPGMLRELAELHPVVRNVFSEASDILGYDLWDLVQNGSDEKLKQTEFTQPIMYVGGMAVWRVWQALEVPEPAVMAGHSLGEYTALTAAGSISFADGLRLVELRGRLMASAVDPGVGGMAAIIGMEDHAVIDLCQLMSSEKAVVEAVNFNAPGQVVISGHLHALEDACTNAREKGARKAMMLPVSVPNHSSLMQPARDELAEAIDKAGLSMPAIPVIQNASAAQPADAAILTASLREHVVSPVNWTGSVQTMKSLGVDVIAEMGPGKVLTGLGKRIDKSITGYPLETPALLEKAITSLGN